MEPKAKNVTITITQACNLDCSYCYEHHKTQNTMDIPTAKKIIDDEFRQARLSNMEEIEFDLFGGEPFLEFNLIKEITEYICATKGNIFCTIFTTTNGTLVW